MPLPQKLDAQGPEGNIMIIMARVTGYMRANGRGPETAAAVKAMMSCDYDELCALAWSLTNTT